MDTLETKPRRRAMPPKLDAKSDTERVHIVAPRALLDRVEDWRASQRPVPGISESIRRLLEIALDAEQAKREAKE